MHVHVATRSLMWLVTPFCWELLPIKL